MTYTPTAADFKYRKIGADYIVPADTPVWGLIVGNLAVAAGFGWAAWRNRY